MDRIFPSGTRRAGQSFLFLLSAAWLAPAYAVDETQVVEVVGATSLPGFEIPVRDMPANVQTYRNVGRQQGGMTDFLEQNAGSVGINNAQGNPFQADLSFRGFSASPLLGLPQGLSVFQDGARINEPFGDVVNWDLLPQSAIAKLQLIPGSNPTFGLNTLGGALAIETKRGRDYPGGSVRVSGGSFGRRAAEFEQGGASGNWDYFVTVNSLKERGWAEHNPSRVKQFFGQGGYRDAATDIAIGLTLADNTLEGTQTSPLSFAAEPRLAYTYPDQNRNRLAFLTMKAQHRLADNITLGANAYWRHYRNASVASNVNDNVGEIDPDTGLPDDMEAFNDRSAIEQKSYGAGVQMSVAGTLAGRRNRMVIGASTDAGHAHFTQSAQPAQFTADRGAIGLGDFEPQTDARTGSRYLGAFVFDSWALAGQWTLTTSGRYNVARVTIADESGNAPELNGRHRFSRFNPAVGINFNPSAGFTAYAAYSEGMRAPTPIELTCADPAAPCKLPNNFLADPPLKKIVSKTFEAGMRGKHDGWNWSAAAYRSDLRDDIQFISSDGVVNAGFFQNVGETRRAGIELSAGTKQGAVDLSARYSYTEASYRTAFTAPGENNTSADADGAIGIRPGDRLPGVPRHTLKLRTDIDLDDRWAIGMNVVGSSAIFARGDENNRDACGRVPGYAVLNVETRYAPLKGLELSLQVNNVFDRRYANFGVLGANYFTGPGRSFDAANPVSEQFRGYGAPRGAWVGVRYAW